MHSEDDPSLRYGGAYHERRTKPWKNNQNFIKDVFQIRYGDLKDGDMKFS